MKTLFVIFALFVAAAHSVPVEDGQEIAPTFDAYRDTRLLLQTRRNRLDPVQLQFRNLNSILGSPFDASKPTRFLIHGWRQDDESDFSTETAATLLNHYDYNVIFVDWSEGAGTINYAAAAGRVEPVGFFVSSQLNWMLENRFVDFSTTGIIGFSLGAHIAGHIGKNSNGLVDTIIGLDPAGPLFAERRPDGRINSGDARYVECLHTNGGLTGAGIGAAICDADFLFITKKDIKKEKDDEFLQIEKPTKCISSRKIVDIRAQVQFIDFEGRSDGESLMKILSQLRPRRVVVVRGNENSSQTLANHCEQNIGSKVFMPHRGEIIDATTESSIYQVRLTEALVSALEFQKGKDSAEIAWINGTITMRNKLIDNSAPTAMVTDDEDHIEITDDDNKVIALDPMADQMPPHDFVFLNELKLAAFKEILLKNNISSEISGGMLLCCNGTLAVKRIDAGKVTIEGCLSEEYFKVRELLYEQYAIV